MKTLNEIELELSRLGFHNRFWGRSEVRELEHILSDDEIMTNVATGRYEGGYAMLLATDRRLLLIDKKVWFLSLEDVRYDMISEVDYHARLLDATVYVRTINKVLRFTSRHQKSLRDLVKLVQERVMELRQPASANNQQLLQQFSNMLSQSQLPTNQTVVPAASAPVAARLPMRPFRRLGAYPTASFTIHQRTLNQPTFHHLA